MRDYNFELRNEDDDITFMPYFSIDEINDNEANNSLSLLERIDAIIRINDAINRKIINKEDEIKYQNILNNHLTFCSNILDINETQMLIFSNILNSRCLNLGSLSKSLRVTKIKGYKYLDDLDTLASKRLISKSSFKEEGDSNYWVPFEVIQSLRKGIAFTMPHYYNLSNKDFFKQLNKLCLYFCCENVSKEITMLDFLNLLKDNPHLEFVKTLDSYSISEENMFFISCLCINLSKYRRLNFINRNDYMDPYELSYKYLNEEKNMNIDLHPLFEKELIEYAKDNFRDNEDIILTKKASFELLGIKETLQNNREDIDLIKHVNITPKEMYYNSKEMESINQLVDLLQDKNYKNIKDRLKLKGMRTGFNCLFFGTPGTGKTETVYQIARLSCRDIMFIDISMTKSHWFGESEKIIRQVFIEYQHKIKRAEENNLPIPILMLNEADAIINKRKDTLTSGVAQTENAIQNIILEELEKIDGIMIATTNLVENIDKAFERRFIYKIEFLKPNTSARNSIWKSLIPELSENEASKLAKDFNLTGGQIENIARKHTINGIINGDGFKFNNIISFCKDESILTDEKNIGFCA